MCGERETLSSHRGALGNLLAMLGARELCLCLPGHLLGSLGRLPLLLGLVLLLQGLALLHLEGLPCALPHVLAGMR